MQSTETPAAGELVDQQLPIADADPTEDAAAPVVKNATVKRGSKPGAPERADDSPPAAGEPAPAGDAVPDAPVKGRPAAYVIVRTENAGAFAGDLSFTDYGRRVVELTGARRLWYWDGAASLSELAARGPSKPDQCKFPAPVDILLFEVIEVITVTPQAREAIEAVPVWSA